MSGRRAPLTIGSVIHNVCALSSTLLVLGLLTVAAYQFSIGSFEFEAPPSGEPMMMASVSAPSAPSPGEAAAPSAKSPESPFVLVQRAGAGGLRHHYTFTRRDGGATLTFTEASAELSSDAGAGFRDQLTRLLVSAAAGVGANGAIFWECVPVSAATAATTPFEFIANPAPELAQATTGGGEPEAFAEYILGRDGRCGNGKLVATFANLGGDATLVVPCPPAEAETEAEAEAAATDAYPHLAAFLRGRVSPPRVHAFWQAVGQTTAARIASPPGGDRQKPFWVSTSGMGVYWLHVRIDSRPKYYTYRPFREWPQPPQPAAASR
jgi:hypothetical protein